MTIVRGPQDLEVTEDDTATFECELSQALADVTWEKVRAQPQPSPPWHQNNNNNAPNKQLILIEQMCPALCSDVLYI